MANIDPNKMPKQELQTQPASFEDRFQNWGQGYFGPSGPSSNFSLFGTEDEKSGAMAGLDVAKLGYGEGLSDVGQNISDIRKKYKERASLAASDPVTAAIMAQKQNAVASARRNLAASGVKGGVGAMAAEEIGRQKDMDVAQSLYGQQRQSLSDLRSLESNTLAGTMGLMQGERATGTASGAPLPPQSKGLMDSVICTELYRQGIMPIEIYEKDQKYGLELSRTNPEVIVGYHLWAKPLVKMMKKSKLLTNIISYPAMKWARQMAGVENSIIGYFAVNLGQPFCGLLGKLFMSSREGKSHV